MNKLRIFSALMLAAGTIHAQPAYQSGFSIGYCGTRPFLTNSDNYFPVLNGIEPGLRFLNKSMESGVFANIMLPAKYEASRTVISGAGTSVITGNETAKLFGMGVKIKKHIATSNEFLKFEVGSGVELYGLKVIYDYPQFDPALMQFEDPDFSSATMSRMWMTGNMMITGGANYEFERFRMYAGFDFRFSVSLMNPRKSPMFPGWSAGIFVPFKKSE